jgi:hypothetical protein
MTSSVENMSDSYNGTYTRTRTGDHVQANLLVCDGLDHADRDHVEECFNDDEEIIERA